MEKEFIKLVTEARKAQKAYFAYKEADQHKENLLQASKTAEHAADRYSVTIPDSPLVLAYQAMRRLQIQFFKLSYGDPRRKKVMIESKVSESAVDKLLKTISNPVDTSLSLF